MNYLIASHQPPEPSIIILPVWLAVTFAIALGAILGSFLNVVAYRLPRGQSLSFPPSRCVNCGRPIRWHDNLPILGWILLGGRCRDCGARFSARYPLIEAGVAIAFLILAWVELIVPGRLHTDAGMAIGYTALARFAFRALLICVLVAAALMELDGFAPPRIVLWGALAVGLAAVVLWPALNEAPIAGAVNGLFFGGLAWPASRSRATGNSRGLMGMVLLAIVGGYLGPAAVPPIATTSLLAHLASVLVFRRAASPSWLVWLPAATIIWLAVRAGFAESVAPHAHGLGWSIAWAGAAACAALAVHFASRGSSERRVAPPLEIHS